MDFIQKILMLLFSTSLCITSAWADDLVGNWKTIDDKTGFPRAVINIKQESDGTYTGKIEKIYALPNGTEPLGLCVKCNGNMKNKPMVGLNILNGFTENKNKKNEYVHGQVLDPLTGNTYKGKIRMNQNGRTITLRGYVGTSLLGRSQTWIKVN